MDVSAILNQPFYTDTDICMILHELLCEIQWYFQNTKALSIPMYYKDCLMTAVKYATLGNFKEVKKLTLACWEIRKEYNAF